LPKSFTPKQRAGNKFLWIFSLHWPGNI
jgi:hypothetical protein